MEDTVTFTREEWAAMMADPVYYGYACRMGHHAREDDPNVIALGCPTCFMIGEAGADMCYDDEPTPEESRAFDRWVRSLEVFPVITCGNCKSTHVGVGGVRRCYAGGKIIR